MESVISTIESVSRNVNLLARLNDQLLSDPNLHTVSFETAMGAVGRLNKTNHALGILHILARVCPKVHGTAEVPRFSPLSNSDSKQNSIRFFEIVTDFLSNPNFAQIAEAKVQLTELCRAYTMLSIRLQCSRRAIVPLRKVMDGVYPEKSQLSPLHSSFVLACLTSKCYFAAMDVLNTGIVKLSKPSTGIVSLDILKYYYYGGLVYIAMGMNQQAMDFFQMVVTVPSIAISSVQVEAYKKLVLLSLIENGKSPKLPSYTSSVVRRNLEAHCTAYFEFMSAFDEKKTETMHQILSERSWDFKQSQNNGLAKKCLEALKRRKIQQLTSVYTAISMEDLRNEIESCSVEDTERIVLRMIEEESIFARIDQAKGLVTFHEDSELYDGPEMVHQLHSLLQESMQLSQTLKHVHSSVSTDPQYIRKAKTKDKVGTMRPVSDIPANDWRDSAQPGAESTA